MSIVSFGHMFELKQWYFCWYFIIFGLWPVIREIRHRGRLNKLWTELVTIYYFKMFQNPTLSRFLFQWHRSEAEVLPLQLVPVLLRQLSFCHLDLRGRRHYTLHLVSQKAKKVTTREHQREQKKSPNVFKSCPKWFH